MNPLRKSNRMRSPLWRMEPIRISVPSRIKMTGESLKARERLKSGLKMVIRATTPAAIREKPMVRVPTRRTGGVGFHSTLQSEPGAAFDFL